VAACFEGEGYIVKVTYDFETEILPILLSESDIEESYQDRPGVIIDYDRDGNVVGIEILHASKRVENSRGLEHT
jgi:uncharacterized protein YuzE